MSYRYREKDREKFEVPAEELAPWLLGKVLCHKYKDFELRGRICETEAYRACDSVTDANREKGGTQLLSGGHLHYFNGGLKRSRVDIVAGPENSPQGVLIRGIDPYGSRPTVSLQAMALDCVQDVDGLDLLESNGKIWLEDDGVDVIPGDPMPRVNVPGDDKLRFWAKGFTFSGK